MDDRRRISLVWLIPLVALLAALWLGYRAYIQQGPLITIRFETAEGLEAGKTRLRHKDVDVGVVEQTYQAVAEEQRVIGGDGGQAAAAPDPAGAPYPWRPGSRSAG